MSCTCTRSTFPLNLPIFKGEGVLQKWNTVRATVFNRKGVFSTSKHCRKSPWKLLSGPGQMIVKLHHIASLLHPTVFIVLSQFCLKKGGLKLLIALF